MKKAVKVVFKTIWIVLGVIAALCVGFVVWWCATEYQPDELARAAVADEDGDLDGVRVETLDDGKISFVAEDACAGMVFYPGAKVDPEAYAPLLTACAREGVTCVLVKPPLDFALLDIDAAAGVAELFPEIDTWLLAGHSLGGVAACEYTAKHPDEVDGVVLLAAFPQNDMTAYGGPMLTLRGTEDGIVTAEEYASAADLMPDDLLELELDGGNHAQFGNYGDQDGDGVATMPREEQQALAVSAISTLV